MNTRRGWCIAVTSFCFLVWLLTREDTQRTGIYDMLAAFVFPCLLAYVVLSLAIAFADWRYDRK